MQYLIGNRAELGHVWNDWNIVAKPDKAGRDLVEHSALIYGIAADGKVTTLYPANFEPVPDRPRRSPAGAVVGRCGARSSRSSPWRWSSA